MSTSPASLSSSSVSSSSLSHSQLKIYSWNILLDIFADDAFTLTPKEILDWSYRRARIHQLLQHWDADIVFLQELNILEFDGRSKRSKEQEQQEKKKNREEEEKKQKIDKAKKNKEKRDAKFSKKSESEADKTSNQLTVDGTANATLSPSDTPSTSRAASPSPSDASATPSPAITPNPTLSSPAENSVAVPSSASSASASASVSASASGSTSASSASTDNVGRNDFGSFLESIGYGYVLQEQKQRKKWDTVIGVGIIYKKTTFSRLLWSEPRSRTLLSALVFKDAEGKSVSELTPADVVYCLNCHLEGEPRKVPERFNQLRSSLDSLKARIEKDFPGFPASHALVVAGGDMNSNHLCPVHRTLVSGGLPANSLCPIANVLANSEDFEHRFRLNSAYAPVAYNSPNYRHAFQMFQQPTFHNNRYLMVHVTDVVDFLYYSRLNTRVDALRLVFLDDCSTNPKVPLKNFSQYQVPLDHKEIAQIIADERKRDAEERNDLGLDSSAAIEVFEDEATLLLSELIETGIPNSKNASDHLPIGTKLTMNRSWINNKWVEAVEKRKSEKSSEKTGEEKKTQTKRERKGKRESTDTSTSSALPAPTCQSQSEDSADAKTSESVPDGSTATSSSSASHSSSSSSNSKSEKVRAVQPLGKKLLNKLLPHERNLLECGQLRNVTHTGATSIWLEADSSTAAQGKVCVYRPMGDDELKYLVSNNELPSSQPYQTIVESREYAEKYLNGLKKVDSNPTAVIEFCCPAPLVESLFATFCKPEDGALSTGLGDKAGGTLPIFNASLAMTETTWRVVKVKRKI